MLDVLIGCAAGYVPDKPGCEWAKDEHWQYIPVPRISERIGCADKAGNIAAHWEAPHFTTSIDAAMTSIPPEMRDEIEITTLYQVARVGINLNHAPDDGPYYGNHDGNSIPIALCIAALNAIRNLSTRGDQK